MRLAIIGLICLISASAAPRAFAHGIPLSVNADSGLQLFAPQLVTFDADEGTFAATPAGSPVALTTAAGFYPVFQGGVPAGAVLTVDAAGSAAHPAALAYWDGSSVLPSPRDVTMTRSSFSAVVHPEDTFVAGGPLSAYSGLEGGHSSVTLALPLDAPTGLYAVGFRVSSPGFEDSETFWAIANHGVDPADFDAGVSAIAASVPEPTTLGLTTAGALSLAFWAWRRRRA